jgi:hypothetical protein
MTGPDGDRPIPYGMRRALALFAFAAFVIAACTAALPHPPYAPHPATALSPVAFPPPPPRVEPIPKQPEGAVWLDGEWTWSGTRWSWYPGRWVMAPPGLTYSPWTWVRATNGTLYFAKGTWRDARGNEALAPRGIVYAKVSTGPVVNAQGETEATGPNILPDEVPDDDLPDAAPAKAAPRAPTPLPSDAGASG